MNIFDFLFENTGKTEKNLILGAKETKSYKAIVEESGKLAYYLRNKLGQDNNILLVAPNSSFSIVAYLGILRSGNICIPLNPGIEKENFELINIRTDSRTGFFSEVVYNRLNPSCECFMERNLYDITHGNGEILECEPEFDGERIAEIIFTSGSTSIPKGVMLSHNNIINNTSSIIQYLGLTDSDIMMVVLPFSYCYGLSLLHTHIRAGGSLVLNNNFIFLGSTVNDLNEYGCTGFAGVPSHFQIMLRKSDLFKSTKFPSLRYVTQAGGKLHNTFIDSFIRTFPDVQFFVMYGQTEATARLSYLPPVMLREKMGSLGKGIPGVDLKVVDEQGNFVSPGETGEILAMGKNVMKGYFRDPESTADVIRNGWLYTGDLATVDADGYIYLTARKKEIIKVAGNRINPKEIEEVIIMMDGVIDCTVEAVDHELLGEAIKATVVVNEPGRNLTKEDIKQHCGAKLSVFKVPTFIEFKESMEVNLSGKKIK